MTNIQCHSNEWKTRLALAFLSLIIAGNILAFHRQDKRYDGAPATAQCISGLDQRNFSKYWVVESEDDNCKVTFMGDTADIVAPKGLTLWRKEKMQGRVTIEYDAMVVYENDNDRVSDLNCFWMATDPQYPDDIFKRMKWRKGVFVNCYSLSLYYLGYGGNYNKTTRFRRYDVDMRAVENNEFRPKILKEYTDEKHLIKPNHWYHIKITNEGHRICYFIDGERLIDFRDPNPHTQGWFGFRTTLSHTRITNFKFSQSPWSNGTAPLNWIGKAPQKTAAVSFGVPFDKGEVKGDDNNVNKLNLTDGNGNIIDSDKWALAYWPDGSVKWCGVAAVVPANSENLSFGKQKIKDSSSKKAKNDDLDIINHNQIIVSNGPLKAFISKNGKNIIDSIFLNGTKTCESIRLVCRTQDKIVNAKTANITFNQYNSIVTNACVEREGKVRSLVKIEGWLKGENGRLWLPFVVRAYFYKGCENIKMVHSFIFDGDQDKDFINALGFAIDVPMKAEPYNRHVAFDCGDGGVWSEAVQPLSGRRVMKGQDGENLEYEQVAGNEIIGYEQLNPTNRKLVDNWAKWNCFRISQLDSESFTIRKKANADCPWIGTLSGHRAGGYAFIGDVENGIEVCMKDFWQACPSGFEVNGATTGKATLIAWLWSPDAEPMDLRHYDKVAHGLDEAYEDVQEGLSTPYGIARTSTLTLIPNNGFKGKAAFADNARHFTDECVILPTSQYLHDKQAFGIWSLPDRSSAIREKVENKISSYIDFYKKAVDQNRWYGFWNYGDFMHAYDPVRHQWNYDVGGYAWDNTELASNMFLWYNFLRTADPEIWRMAEAMTRHTAEVDVYHIGKLAKLGSRHNVSHWGCGAKEVRISQAAWNRFYYYLTTDERCGDLMAEVKDADSTFYELDPMRLAQPRDQFPCSQPARLRIGPDWMALAGNWMTQWERTKDEYYKNKIIRGMTSIAKLPNGLFTGPKALGFNPQTGEITVEGDTTLLCTNHLMTIMGGFEVMNELMRMVNVPEWNKAWTDHAFRYKDMAWEVSKNKFRVSRLGAYAAYMKMDSEKAKETWDGLISQRGKAPDGSKANVLDNSGYSTIMPPDTPWQIDEYPGISTNGAASWSLDAIYMMEVIPPDDYVSE